MAKLGKKGIFLTFIAISLIAAFMIIFAPTPIDILDDSKSVEVRVKTLNNLAEDLEKVYLERALYSISVKSINSIIGYMESENQFIADFENAFSEVAYLGTINEVPIDNYLNPNIMNEDTYLSMIQQMIGLSEKAYGIDMDIYVHGFRVYQERPWSMIIESNVSYEIISETAVWSRNPIIRTEVSILRFKDPLFSANTNGAYSKVINKTDIRINEWNEGSVRDHLRYGTYVHFEESKAPSFIMRFTNDTRNSSCCGIESMVNPNLLLISDHTESYADYQFFNGTYTDKCEEIYNLTGLWDEYTDFKLDLAHIANYNLTYIDIVRTC